MPPKDKKPPPNKQTGILPFAGFSRVIKVKTYTNLEPLALEKVGCKICTKTFSNSGALAGHMMWKHSKEQQSSSKQNEMPEEIEIAEDSQQSSSKQNEMPEEIEFA